jgi:hypothetical protein
MIGQGTPDNLRRNDFVHCAVAAKHYFNQTPLYERNYNRLWGFFRNAHAGARHVVRHPAGMVFRLDVKEDHRYTSVIELSVAPREGGTPGLNLTMTVRMYHDARVAEVVDCSGYGRFEPEYRYPNQRMLQRDEKRQINQLLGEWLDFFVRRSGSRVAEPQDAA